MDVSEQDGVADEIAIEDLSKYKDYQDKITIKFFTEDDEHIFTHSFNVLDTIEIVKKRFVTTFNVPFEIVRIYHTNFELRDKDFLGNLQTDEYGIIRLKAVSQDAKRPIRVDSAYQNFVIPDILTVRVEEGDDIKEVVVEIENRAVEEPGLGGYKNTRTGKYKH